MGYSFFHKAPNGVEYQCESSVTAFLEENPWADEDDEAVARYQLDEYGAVFISPYESIITEAFELVAACNHYYDEILDGQRLDPCPSCGSRNVCVDDCEGDGFTDRVYRMTCLSCLRTVPSQPGAGWHERQAAVDAWNNRRR